MSDILKFNLAVFFKFLEKLTNLKSQKSQNGKSENKGSSEYFLEKYGDSNSTYLSSLKGGT